MQAKQNKELVDTALYIMNVNY